MLRCCSTLSLALAFASAANAASLSVNSDKTTYLVGETATLTIVGDNEGAYAYGIYGRLDYSGALVDNGTRSQNALVNPDEGPWAQGALTAGDDGINAYSEAFNQVTLYSYPAPIVPTPLATVTLIAQAVGLVDVDWHTAEGTGEELYFFGLVDAPGTSFTIVPEPTTAVLLGLGLVTVTAHRALRVRRPRDA